MMNRKQKSAFIKMMKWSIRKMFEEYAGMVCCSQDLARCLYEAWDEMSEDGEIVDC